MSANSNLLTESNWRTVLQKYRLRDNGLQRALSTYEDLEENQYDERLRRIASVTQLANALKRNRDVAANSDAVDELTEIIGAANVEQRDITRARTQAQRTQATSAGARGAHREDEQDEDENEEEDDESAEYGARLLAAVEKLKRSRDLSYPFIVCDARPYCGLMIAKRITPQHRTELTRVTGGRRFLPGTCSVEGGVLNFSMDRPPSGLARKLQESIRQFTGRRIRVVVGTETSEDDEEEGDAAAGTVQADDDATQGRRNATEETDESETNEEQEETASEPHSGSSRGRRPAAANPPSARRETEPAPTPRRETPSRRNLPRATLARAPQVWHGARGIVDRRIQSLKQAIRAEYANDEPDLIQEIDQKIGRLDGVLDNLDHRLADALSNANDAATPAARTSQLRNARAILANYINYVRSEPLITAIDQNPFGVNTGLRRLLTDSLTHMAQAIGTGAAR